MPFPIQNIYLEAREQIGNMWALFPLGFVLTLFVKSISHRQAISDVLSTSAASALIKHLWFDVYLNLIDTSSAIGHSVSRHVAHPLENPVFEWLQSRWQTSDRDIVRFGPSRIELEPIKLVLEFIPDPKLESFAWTSVDGQRHSGKITFTYNIATAANVAVSPMANPTPSPTATFAGDEDFDRSMFGHYLKGFMVAFMAVVKSLKSKAKHFIVRARYQVRSLRSMDFFSPESLTKLAVLFDTSSIILFFSLPLLFTLLRIIYKAFLWTTAGIWLPILEPLVRYLRKALEPSAVRAPVIPAPLVEADPPAVIIDEHHVARPRAELAPDAVPLIDLVEAPPAPAAASSLEPETTNMAPAVAAASIFSANFRKSASSPADASTHPIVIRSSLIAADSAPESNGVPPPASASLDTVEATLTNDLPSASPIAAQPDLPRVGIDLTARDFCDVSSLIDFFKPNAIERSVSEPACSPNDVVVTPRPTSASFLDLAASPRVPSACLIDLLNAKEQAEECILALDTPIPSSCTLPMDVYPLPSKSRYDFTLSHVSLVKFSLDAAPASRSKRVSRTSSRSPTLDSESNSAILPLAQSPSADVPPSPTKKLESSAPGHIAPPISPYVPWDKRSSEPKVNDDIPSWFTAYRPDSPQLPAIRGTLISGDRYTGACLWNDAEPAEMTDPNPRPTTSRQKKRRSVSSADTKKVNLEPATSRSKKAFTFDPSLFSIHSVPIKNEVDEEKGKTGLPDQAEPKPFDFVLSSESSFFAGPAPQVTDPTSSRLPFPLATLPAPAQAISKSVPTERSPPFSFELPLSAGEPSPTSSDVASSTPKHSRTPSSKNETAAPSSHSASSDDFFQLPDLPHVSFSTIETSTRIMSPDLGPIDDVKALWQSEQPIFDPNDFCFDLDGLMDDYPSFPSPPIDISVQTGIDEPAYQTKGAFEPVTEEVVFSNDLLTPMTNRSFERQQEVQAALEDKVHLIFDEMNAFATASGNVFDPTRPWDSLPNHLWNDVYELFDAAQRVGLLVSLSYDGVTFSVDMTEMLQDSQHALPSPLSPVTQRRPDRSLPGCWPDHSASESTSSIDLRLLDVYNPQYGSQLPRAEINLAEGTYEERPSHFKVVFSPLESTFPLEHSSEASSPPNVKSGDSIPTEPAAEDRNEPRTPTKIREPQPETLVTPENVIKSIPLIIKEQLADPYIALYSPSPVTVPESILFPDLLKKKQGSSPLFAQVPEPSIAPYPLLNPFATTPGGTSPVSQPPAEDIRASDDFCVPSSRIPSPPPRPRSASVGATPITTPREPEIQLCASSDLLDVPPEGVREEYHAHTEIGMEEEEMDDLDLVEQMLSGLTVSSPGLHPALLLPSFPHPPKTSLPMARKRTSPRYSSAKTAIRAIISPIKTKTRFSHLQAAGPIELNSGDELLSSACHCMTCERARAFELEHEESDPGKSYAVPLYFDPPVPSTSASGQAESLTAAMSGSASSSVMVAAGHAHSDEEASIPGEENAKSAWAEAREEQVVFLGKGKAKERGEKVSRPSQSVEAPRSKRFKTGSSPIPPKPRRDAPDSDISMTGLEGSSEDWLARINSFKSQDKPEYKRAKPGSARIPHPQSFSRPKAEGQIHPPSKHSQPPAPSLDRRHAIAAGTASSPPVQSNNEGWTAVRPKRRRR
ncbi:hypothetical protein IAU59_005790 [Kwoniella sp. CBS 9459]